MTNQRRTLAVSIATPGGDNPLLLDLKQSAPIYRGVPLNPRQLVLVAKGGTPPYAYSILATSSNDLPPGLSIPTPTEGDVDGTATQAGHYSFIAQVQDDASNTFAHSFSIDVLSQLFWVGPPPPVGELTIAYSYQFRVYDASGTLLTSGFTFDGTLPAGLSLSSSGALTGTPTSPEGISYATIHATDGADTLDIPIVITIVAKVAGVYLEDRTSPVGWGGDHWLPSMVRLQDWSAHLVITGGVPPYSITPSPFNPPPTGITVNSARRTVGGKTSDAASPYSVLFTVLISDALGAGTSVQRNVFIIDSQQGRITPQHNGSDVAGGDGPTKFNLVEGANVSIAASNDGDTVNFEISATPPSIGDISTINDVGPEGSSGNIHIEGIGVNSNGGLFVDNVYTPPVTTKGDLFGFSTTQARIPIGTNAQRLRANSAQSLGVDWADISKVMGFGIDGGGIALTAGMVSRAVRAKGNYTIKLSSIFLAPGSAAASIVLDVLTATYSNYDTGTSLVASANPTLSSAIKAEDSTLTGWTTAIVDGNFYWIEIVSVTGVTGVTLDLGLIEAI